MMIGNVFYDLSHLDPINIQCRTDIREQDLNIRVRFSNHCYTCSCKDDHYIGHDLMRDHRNARRLFDKQRYELSINLPTIIKNLPTARVHQTHQVRNYMHISTDLGVLQYRAFFHLKRSQKGQDFDLDMFVESAYGLDSVPPNAQGNGQVRFLVLATKTFKGEQIRFDHGRNLHSRGGRR